MAQKSISNSIQPQDLCESVHLLLCYETQVGNYISFKIRTENNKKKSLYNLSSLLSLETAVAKIISSQGSLRSCSGAFERVA